MAEKKRQQKEPEMKIVSVEVGSLFLKRIGREKSTRFDSQLRSFLEHTALPRAGTKTGRLLPLVETDLSRFRNLRLNAELDRVMACGPSKDPVLHRGVAVGAHPVTELGHATPVPVHLLVALGPRHGADVSELERSEMEILQSVARDHYGNVDSALAISNLRRMADVLRTDRRHPELHRLIVEAVQKRQKLGDRELYKVISNIAARTYIDSDQLDNALHTMLTAGELTVDQIDAVRDQLRQLAEKSRHPMRLLDVQRVVQSVAAKKTAHV